jgi:hypothetical protein
MQPPKPYLPRIPPLSAKLRSTFAFHEVGSHPHPIGPRPALRLDAYCFCEDFDDRDD